MRVGFLFNHDHSHQVAHSLPIALSLASGGFKGEIVVATTRPRLAAEVLRLAGGSLPKKIESVSLSLSGSRRRLGDAIERMVPSRKILIYGQHVDFFRGLDVLVVAEKTSLVLKSLYGLDRLKMIHTRHGAGDRAIGFDSASARFDHVLCSGPLIRDRLVRDAGIEASRVSIVGYPKFDLLGARRNESTGVNPEETLYNPHCSPHLSSWFPHGLGVLDHFLSKPHRRLTVAPHVMLFERPFTLSIDKLRIKRPPRPALRHRQASHLSIDTGSEACTDMSYTRRAGVYLGDVSSQVYEFLLTPRPCVFLNSHRVKWQGDPNYAHWATGPVIERPEELERGLNAAVEDHSKRYRPVQEALFAERFDLTERPCAERAAEVVAHIAARRQ